MPEETRPLTPAMRKALWAKVGGTFRRRVPMILFMIAVVVGTVGLSGWEDGGLSEAAIFALACTLGFGALFLAAGWGLYAGFIARALRNGTYTILAGPFRVQRRPSQNAHYLWVGTERFHLDPDAPDQGGPSIDEAERGTALFADNGVVLVAWDEAGRCVYRDPDYDPAADAMLADLLEGAETAAIPGEAAPAD